MDRKYVILGLVALIAVFALGVLVDPALAAKGKSASEVGHSVQKMLQDFGTPVLFTVAGVIGIVAVVKRDIGLGFTLLIVTLLVGGFLVNPGGIEHTAGKIADTLFGG